MKRRLLIWIGLTAVLATAFAFYQSIFEFHGGRIKIATGHSEEFALLYATTAVSCGLAWLAFRISLWLCRRFLRSSILTVALPTASMLTVFLVLFGEADANRQFRRYFGEGPLIRDESYGYWNELSSSSDPSLRSAALSALANAKLEKATPIFVRCLLDPDKEVRAQALRGLAETGPAPKEALPALIGFVTAEPHDNYILRSNAIQAIGKMGPDGAVACDVLKKIVSDNLMNHDEAAKALLAIDTPNDYLPFFMACMRNQSSNFDGTSTDDSVLYTLVKIGKPAVPGLIGVLKDGKKSSKAGAMHALRRIGPAAAEAMPDLRNVFEKASIDLRLLAAYTMWSIEPNADAILPTLMDLLKTELKSSPPDVHDIALVLWDMGAAARPAVPLLIEVIEKHPDNRSVSECVAALAAIAPNDPAVVAALATGINDRNNAALRHAAAEAVGRIGAPAKAAVPALIKMLNDREPWRRKDAITALLAVDPSEMPAIMTAIESLLREKDSIHRAAAINFLAKIGAPNAVPLLVEELSDSDMYNRGRAAGVLRQFGPPPKPAAAALGKMLRDDTSNNCETAFNSLSAMGPDAAEALPQLEVFYIKSRGSTQDEILETIRRLDRWRAFWLRWESAIIWGSIILGIVILLEALARCFGLFDRGKRKNGTQRSSLTRQS